MNININVPLKLFERLITAIEQLAQDYRTVHANTLYAQEYLDKPVDKSVGRTYYQSDDEIYKEEQEEKRRRLLEYGETGTT